MSREYQSSHPTLSDALAVNEPATQGGVVPDLGFLQGQSPWLILALALIAAVTFLVLRLAKRGDKEGQRSLDAVDNALDYLATSAVRDREEKEEKERELTEVRAEHQEALDALEKCEQKAEQAVRGVR